MATAVLYLINPWWFSAALDFWAMLVACIGAVWVVNQLKQLA